MIKLFLVLWWVWNKPKFYKTEYGYTFSIFGCLWFYSTEFKKLRYGGRAKMTIEFKQ